MERSGEFHTGQADEERRQAVGEHLRVLHEHPMIKKYQPTLLGEGMHHAVFTVENQKGLPRNVVAKVRRWHAIRSIEEAGNEDFPKVLQETLEREKESVRVFKEYFGRAALAEKVMIQNVPVTAELLRTASPEDEPMGRIPAGVHEAATLVTIQEKAPAEAFGAESIGVQTFYLEDHPYIIDGTALDDYQTLNRAFIDNVPQNDPAFASSLTPEEGDAATLFEQIDREPKLREALSEVVRNAIQYSAETGEYLDFVGDNNIRVYPEQKDGEKQWRVVLIDARVSGNVFGEGRAALKKMLNQEPLSDREIAKAEMAMTYTRFVNALASRLGMSERLTISDRPVAEQGAFLMGYFNMLREHQEEMLKEATAQGG